MTDIVERLRHTIYPEMQEARTEILRLRDEIEQLRATVVILADKMHAHLLPDGTYTAVAAGPPHPVKDHGYTDEIERLRGE